MQGKHIVLGVTGGIAAYKAPLLVRLLRAAGAEVVPVMTRSAQAFVTPVTLQAVSGEPVRDDLWDADAEAAMGHIELARWADAVVVAPATAHFIASIANGTAGDLLSTLYLATEAPTLIAPAMNRVMWEHPATRRNIDRVRGDGVRIVGPGIGEQACGEVGPGRMAEPEEIVAAIDDLLASPAGNTALQGVGVLVTAGPTREPIDPVRFISNNSSGKQGFALAAAARDAGARVTLVTGPVNLETPTGVRRIDVTTAVEMHDAVMRCAGDAEIVIGVAAVADYRPATPHERKIKKSEQAGAAPSVALIENPDILKCLAALEKPPFLVGFAAETHDPIRYAREKRERKGIDAIIVNDVSDKTIGFDSDDNAVTLIHAGGETQFPIQSKREIARKLVGAIAELFHRTTI